MKIAICFSGQIRTGCHAFPNIKKFIGDVWDSCDFFLHTWNMSYNKFTPEQIKNNVKEYNIHKLDIEEIKNLYPFKLTRVDNTKLNNYDQWESWLLSIQLKQQYENINRMKYDYVVKMRPDMIYHESLNLRDIIKNIKHHSITVIDEFMLARVPTVDDTFYAATSNMMDVSSMYVNKINEYQKPDPWSANLGFYKYLKKYGIRINSLGSPYLYRYAILRDQCLSFDPITEYEKCEECDRLIYYPGITRKYSLSEQDLQKINKI